MKGFKDPPVVDAALMRLTKYVALSLDNVVMFKYELDR